MNAWHFDLLERECKCLRSDNKWLREQLDVKNDQIDTYSSACVKALDEKGALRAENERLRAALRDVTSEIDRGRHSNALTAARKLLAEIEGEADGPAREEDGRG